VKVDKKYLIGEMNEGFKLIMFNFNHERLAFGMLAEGMLKKLLLATLAHLENNRVTDEVLWMHYKRMLRYYNTFTS